METAELSNNGQITVPSSLRHGLKVGTRFAVERSGDTLTLTPVEEDAERELKKSYIAKIRAIEQKGEFSTYSSVEELMNHLLNA